MHHVKQNIRHQPNINHNTLIIFWHFKVNGAFCYVDMYSVTVLFLYITRTVIKILNDIQILYSVALLAALSIKMAYPRRVRTNNWSICGFEVEIKALLWMSLLHYAPTCTGLFWQPGLFKTSWTQSRSGYMKSRPQLLFFSRYFGRTIIPLK